MSRHKGSLGHDVLGLVLIGLAGWTCVSIGLAAKAPPEAPGATQQLFLWIVDGIGAGPGIFLCLGVALLGGRLWVQGVAGRMLRHLVGLGLATLSLSVLAGAFDAQAGGALGSATGGAVSRGMSRLVGVPFGLAILSLVVWYAWLRPRLLSERKTEPVQPVSRISADSEGVSPEEASALLPRTPAAPAAPKAAAAQTSNSTLESAATVPEKPTPSLSPYPPDVRVHGGIPEGARPLERSHVPSPSPSAPRARARVDAPGQPTAQHPGAGRGEPAGAHLAAQPRGPGERAPLATPGGSPAQRPGGAVAPAPVPAGAQLYPPPPPTPAAALHAAAAPLVAPLPDPAPAAAPEPSVQELPARAFDPLPPRPSWEEASSAEEPEEDVVEEEPVDAYGTPVSLVESLRRANAEALLARGETPEAELDEDEEGLLEDEDDGEPDSEEDSLEEDSDDDDDEDDADEEAVPEREAPAWAASAAVEDDESDEDDADLEDDEEPDDVAALEAPVALAPAVGTEADQDLDDEDAEQELDEEPEAERSEAPEDDDLDGEEPAEDEAAFDTEEDEDAVFAADGAVEPEDPASKAPAARQLSFLGSEELREESLSPAPLEAKAAPEPEADPDLEPTDQGAEREVELQPRSASAMSAAAAPDEEDLLYRAGCLFLERGRVAVSMLQREFGLDFKQATALLDQLQEAGLIGPYLGGQRRDILLDLEQWRERVSVS